MTLRIINNKRIDLTDDEFKLYQQICRSYDAPPNIKGEDLFQGLFETDKSGIIIFLKPPTQKYTSMEVYMFLVTIMVHQHIGSACREAEELIIDGRKVIEDGKKVIKECKEVLEKLKSV